MHLFIPDRTGKKELGEIKKLIRERYNCEIIDGIQEVIDSSGAVVYDRSIATFRKITRATGHSGWLLEQGNEGFIEWKTYPLPQKCTTPTAVIIFPLAFGNGSVAPQPTGSFDLCINGKKLFRLRVVKSDDRWVNEDEEAELLYVVKRLEVAPPGLPKSLDEQISEESFASFGYALLKIPVSLLKLRASQLMRITSSNRIESKRWARIEGCKHSNNESSLTSIDYSRGLAGLFNKNYREKIDSYTYFYGDLHCHSGEGVKGLGSGCGESSLDDNYRYAREVANLDFCALTCHDFDIRGEEDWSYRKEKANEYLDEGRFITFVAFEWSSEKFGHRTVYYQKGDVPLLSSRAGGKLRTSEELWNAFDELGEGVVAIPHHPASMDNPCCWEHFNPKYDRLVEIYSGNALSSEYLGCPLMSTVGDRIEGLFVTDALERGYRMGFMASSDSHDGHPGNSQLDPRHPHMGHFVGSGRIVCLAESLSREHLFNAIQNRRVYATTGERIVLDFRINGALMGSEICPNDIRGEVEVTCKVKGTSEIDRISIIKNGALLYTKQCSRERKIEELLFTDNHFEPKRDNYYYIRVIQKDYEMAWSSPIWIGK